jgi:anthranilate/para-aminobenzoate synthase component I
MALARLTLRRDPLDVLACIAGEPGAFLLEVPDPEHPAAILGCRPTAELRIRTGDADPAAAIARFVAAAPRTETGLPFPLAGGVVACLTYELGVGLAPRPIRHLPVEPLAVLRHHDPLLVYDRRRSGYALVGSGAPAMRPPWLELLSRPVPGWRGSLGAAPLAATMAAERYRVAVREVLAYLAAGDCYQVNLTQPFTAPLAGPAWALLDRLARCHPAPYTAYLDLGGPVVVANSPELLLRRRGRRVETRPIKGTRPRADRAGGDDALVAELRRDPKERAEHVMIVDLERNDLGRVCDPGSVRVDELARAESHPSLHHLVSIVSGRLRDGVDTGALLAATFPGGSVTGAPKVRAMEIIAELEPRPRGVYTGALGLVAPDDLELGLPIRTAVVADRQVRWHAGGGIVADSDPERELAETWLKTAALRLALGETSGTELDRCSSG